MNDSTLLYRQVHPKFIRQGRITSQVFEPTAKDGKRLSVYNGDLITAQDAWCDYMNKRRGESHGVTAVTPSECRKQDLTVTTDPSTFLEHALISFTDLTSGQIKNKARILRGIAESRGWQYQP